MENRSVVIHLPYFKQGNDLRMCLDDTENLADALEAHAEQMDAAAKQLRAIKKIVAGQPVEVNAGTHHIGITGPEAVLEQLLAEELAEKDDLDDLEDDLDDLEDELDDLEEEASAISD